MSFSTLKYTFRFSKYITVAVSAKQTFKKSSYNESHNCPLSLSLSLEVAKCKLLQSYILHFKRTLIQSGLVDAHVRALRFLTRAQS